MWLSCDASKAYQHSDGVYDLLIVDNHFRAFELSKFISPTPETLLDFFPIAQQSPSAPFAYLAGARIT